MSFLTPADLCIMNLIQLVYDVYSHIQLYRDHTLVPIQQQWDKMLQEIQQQVYDLARVHLNQV